MSQQLLLAALEPSGWLAMTKDALGEPVQQKVPDVGIITESLNQIIHALSGGYASIEPATSGVMWALVTIDVVYFGIMVSLGLSGWESWFQKMIGISFWLYFIHDFEKHANALVTSLVSIGMMVGGQPGSDWRIILDPSRILSKGFEMTKVLLDNMPELSMWGPTDFLGSGIAFLLLLLAFLAIAANAYMLVVGFYLSLCVAGAFLPFALFPQTRGFAMRGITAVVAHGVHLMLVAVATALVESVVRGLKFSEIPTMHETWSMVFVMGTMAVLAWKVPQDFARGFMNGSASIGGSDVAGMAKQVVYTTMMAVGTAARGADVVIKAADNRPTDSGARPSQSIRGGGGAAGGARPHSPPGGDSSYPQRSGGSGPPGGAGAAPERATAAPSAATAKEPILTTGAAQ